MKVTFLLLTSRFQAPVGMLIRYLGQGPGLASGWGLVARGTNLVSRGLEISAPPHPPTSWEQLEIELITSCQGFNQS